MPVTVEQSNPTSNDPRAESPSVVVPDGGADIPAWLAARRERSVEPETATDTGTTPPARKPPVPPLPAAKPSLKNLGIRIVSGEATEWARGRVRTWFSKQGMVGVAVSLLLHAVVLAILACILVSQVSKTELSTIWGMQGNSDELGADIILDTEIPGDEGESAPLEITNASQSIDAMGVQGDLTESIRVGLGGKGNGEGESGDGAGLGVGALKVPGHAQTKGSFSAWADPRDPKPNEDYEIVIQVKLPEDVKKFRASDISGVVIGTDSYRQTIKFKSNEVLPIENGIVRIRIHVPGAYKLVRDTIRIESKMLREKQIFEIEF